MIAHELGCPALRRSATDAQALLGPTPCLPCDCIQDNLMEALRACSCSLLQAKITIDTVIQRVGDALAAGAFQALVPSLGFGPAGVAATAVPVCAAWAILGYRLGARQVALAQVSADKAGLGA